MKFAGSWTWAAWFGRLLAQQALPIAADAQHVIVCPVPLHWLRRWRRGYNQSHLLAAAFARAGGWPLTPILRRRRHAPPQTAVPASHRAANVRHCFALAPVDLSGCSVWLIDDVKTSGATAAACSRLLRRAGAQSVWLAVVAVAGS
jgi:ComF family protein